MGVETDWVRVCAVEWFISFDEEGSFPRWCRFRIRWKDLLLFHLLLSDGNGDERI